MMAEQQMTYKKSKFLRYEGATVEKEKEKEKEAVKPHDADSNSYFFECQLSRIVQLPISYVGKAKIMENLTKLLSTMIEGKCIEEGYVKPNSIQILSYSGGIVKSQNIQYLVIFTCDVCYPVEGMEIECKVRTKTKAGLTAEIVPTKKEIESSVSFKSPLMIFVARDHHYDTTDDDNHNMNYYIDKLNVNDIITVEVIGQRFELNDKYISVIAEYKKKK